MHPYLADHTTPQHSADAAASTVEPFHQLPALCMGITSAAAQFVAYMQVSLENDTSLSEEALSTTSLRFGGRRETSYFRGGFSRDSWDD